MNAYMTLAEKITAVLDLLMTKAFLSQKTKVNLLLGDIVRKDIDIFEVLTILDRLQREGKVNIQSITQAPVNKFSGTFKIVEAMYTIEYDLKHPDRNQLGEGHIIGLEIEPPLLNECEALKLNKEHIENIAKLFVISDHPQSLKLSCPLCRSQLGEISEESIWQEVYRGKIFKCKERRHEILVTYKNNQINTSFKAVSEEEIPSKT